MKRIATTLAIVLVSASAAVAQTGADVAVTRAEPAELFTTPVERSLLPANSVTITTGTSVDATADSTFTARDRALLGLDSTALVKQTVFQGGNEPASLR